MTTATTRGIHLVTAVTVALLAIPVFAALVWGVWRLLFWAIVDASPNVRHVHPTGMPAPGPMPPGTTSLVGGTGAIPLELVGFVTLGAVATVALSLVVAGKRRDGTRSDRVD
jgi:hypothetical protein